MQFGGLQKDGLRYGKCYRAFTTTMKAFHAMEALPMNVDILSDSQMQARYQNALEALALLGETLYSEMTCAAGVLKTKKN